MKKKENKSSDIEIVFDELIQKNWYYNTVYAHLLKFENEFNDLSLVDFILNCDNATTKVFITLLGNKVPIRRIIDQKSYYEGDKALSEFELYLTKFIVAHCMVKYFRSVESIEEGEDFERRHNEAKRRLNYFDQIVSISESKKYDFKYCIDYGKYRYVNEKGVCQDWLFKLNTKKYTIIDNEQLDKLVKGTGSNTQFPLKAIEPIKLDASQTQIVFLFKSLIKEKLINENLNPKLWHLVATYFTDKDNKQITNIHQTKSNLENTKTGKPKAKADTIEAIAKEVKKPL